MFKNINRKTHMEVLAISTLLTLVITWVSAEDIQQRMRGSKQSICDSSACIGPVKLSLPDEPKQTSQYLNTHVSVMVSQPEVLVYSTTRSFYSAYCYNGGVLDKNTGCYKTFVPLPPSELEAAEWKVRGACKIGNSCAPEGSCWGSGANECIDPKANKWVSSRKHSNMGEYWMMSAFHTCTLSWECYQKEFKLPTHLSIDNSGNFVSMTTLLNGTEIEITSTTRQIQLSSDTTLFLYPTTPVQHYEEEVSCYIQEDELKCVGYVEIKGRKHAVPLDFGRSLLSTYRNYGFSIFDPKIQILGKIYHIVDKNMTSGIDKSSNLEDIIEIQNGMHWQNIQVHNTIQVLNNEIFKLQEIILKIVQSVGKLDDELVGNLLGYRMKTKWFNEKMFYQCPCTQEYFSEGSNCAFSRVFKEGRSVPKTNSSICSLVHPEGTANISLFEKHSNHWIDLSEPPPESSYHEWDGWSWLAEKKNVIIEQFASNFENSVGTKTILESIEERLGVLGILKWLNSISSCVAWVSLVLHCLRR